MTEWNKYWEQEYKNVLSISLDQVINNDAVYYLLKSALLNSEIFTKRKRIKLLDAGCGSGLRSLALIKEFNEIDFDVTFFDLTEESLNLVKSLIRVNHLENKARFYFVLGDLLLLPFKNEEFDIVWNGGVMEHFKGGERQKIFTEIYNVCQKGGVYFALVPNYLNIFMVLRQKYLEKKGVWEYGYQRNFTIFELGKRMKASGFKILNESGNGSFYPLLWFISKALKLFPRTRNNEISKQTNLSKKRDYSSLKRLPEKIEAKLRIGKFIGGNIAICGKK